MTDGRRYISRVHLEVLAQYMERYPALALSNARSREGVWRSQRLWDKIARTLNRIEPGVSKDGKSWSKYWYDIKFKTRRKYLLQQQRAAMGHPSTRAAELNPIEQRILRLLTDKDGNLLLPASHSSVRGYYNIQVAKNSPDTNIKMLNENSKDSDSDGKIDDSGGTDNVECDTIDTPDYHPTEKQKKYRETNNEIEMCMQDTALEDPIQILLPEDKKSIEELRRELVEFELKKEKELFEMEIQERREKHEMEMSILRIRKQIMLKELNKL